MRIFGSTARRALERARRLTAGLVPSGRWPLAVGMAASLLVSALGPLAPVQADTPVDPDARLQFVIKSIYIRENESFYGSSDLHFLAMLCPENTKPIDGSYSGCGAGSFASIDHDFSASSGDDVVLEPAVPGKGDASSGNVAPEFGLPVYRGHRYVLWAYISNTDEISLNPSLGEILVRVDSEHGWGIGTGTVRSNSGDFDLTYEIRRAPLPDLRVKNFWIDDEPGGSFVCGEIQNAGQGPARPSALTVRTEGAVVETFTLPALVVGGSYPHCIKRSLLPVKKHNLVFSIDEARQIPEMEEYNNVGVTTVEAVAPGVAGAEPTTSAPGTLPSPEPKPSGDKPEPSGAQADLTVKAIKVNGQAPDGKDDCKVGKNAVTAVVKNAGKGDSGSFAVRLTVDGNDLNTSVDSLDAGQEREVRFDNVQLKAGEHMLQAVADADHAIAESNENNNELKVTARCKTAE